MYPKIVKNFIYPAISQVRKENILYHLNELEKSQWLGSQELASKQWFDLKSLLNAIYENNDYYRRRFIETGIKPSQMNSYADFLKIPILEKEELRKNVKFMISNSNKDIIESRKTSGSTGIPLEILKGRDSYGRNRALFHRYYAWYGIEIGDRQARFFGHPVTFKARLKENIQDILLNKIRLDPVFLTTRNMINFYKRLKKEKPKYFYGYPSAIYEFAKFMDNNSFNPQKLCIKVIITTGETLYKFQKDFLEAFFKVKVVNEYGCSECGIIAFECPNGGLHLSTDNLLIEILKNGIPAQPGETGEVVITELFNYFVPIIRYKIGDLAKVSEKQYCQCGKGLTCIDSIEGRESQFINLPNGRKVHTELFHYISDGLSQNNGSIKQFRVIQDKELEFTVEYISDGNSVDRSLNYMREKLKQFIGQDITINFKGVESFKRDNSGKLRYFVSRL